MREYIHNRCKESRVISSKLIKKDKIISNTLSLAPTISGLKKRIPFMTHIHKLRKLWVAKHKRAFDMAHRFPYNKIKKEALEYIINNTAWKGSRFKKLVKAITIPQRNFGTISRGDKLYYKKIKRLIKVNPDDIRILKYLNSSPFNLRPGDPSTNRSIGDNPDYHYDDITRSLTPQSEMLEQLLPNPKGYSSDYLDKKQFDKFENLYSKIYD